MLHRGALTRHARACNQPHVCVRKQLTRGRKISAAEVQSATSSHASLVTECEKLIQLKEAGADKEQIEQQIQHITQLSAAAGTDKIVPELNNGFFRGYTLTGQTAQRFSTVISLGVLSFNKYQPQNMKVKMAAVNDSGGVFKGPKGGVEQAYTVVAYFDFVQQEGEDEEAVPTGLKGRHNAIAEYHTVADNPQRLTIQFNKLQLEPGDKSPEHMQRWLDTLLPHNPDMDPKTGLLTVDMPQHPPEAWLDHLLMIPEYQLLKGSFGSVTLLQRVQE